jgi:hypothetical protein
MSLNQIVSPLGNPLDIIVSDVKCSGIDFNPPLAPLAPGWVLTTTGGDGKASWQAPAGASDVQSITAGDASISIGGTAQNPTVTATGDFNPFGVIQTGGDLIVTTPGVINLSSTESFSLSQTTGTANYVGTGTTVSPVGGSGTSGFLILNNFALNAQAATVINVANGAVAVTSVIMLQAFSAGLLPIQYGMVLELQSVLAGSFSFSIFNSNPTGTDITSSQFAIAYMTC